MTFKRLFFITEFAYVMYGYNINAIQDRYLINAGQKNGLQFILYTAQNQHCDAAKKYDGAGFEVTIHEPINSRPLFSMSPSINLTPGTVINVLLKPTVFRRKTAHLGLCNSSVYLYNGRRLYDKSMCVQSCFIKRVLRQCKCAPTQIVRGSENFFLVNFGVDFTKYKTCQTSQFGCMKLQEFETLVADNFKTNCPECLQPCFETKYDTLISSQKFPTHNMMKYFKNTFNEMTSADIQKNYLIVNFFFENLQTITVVETQAFTFVDLTIYCGNVVILFLGMSFMGIGDIVQFVSVNLVDLIINWKSRFNQSTRIHGSNRIIFITNQIPLNLERTGERNETKNIKIYVKSKQGNLKVGQRRK